MDKKLRHKRMLSYYAWFRKIRTPDYKPVAEIKGSNIITNDALFIAHISEVCTMKLEDKPELVKNKLRYIVKDLSGASLAKVDRAFNVYTMNDEYVGTIYNQFKLWIWFLFYVFIILLFLLLGLSGFKKTGYEIKPENIIISEEDGNVVVDECNILFDYYGNKLIAPGRYSSYYFNVINTNSKDVDVVFTLSDINEEHLPMVYRLVHDNEYVSGSATEWLEPLDVTYSFHLPAKSTITLRLDWHWEELDDEFDTRIGSEGTAIYTINLIFTYLY